MAAGSAGYGAGSNTELRWPHVTATAGSTRRQPPEADFGAPSSDDVGELGRARGSQMTPHTRSIGHGRRERGGGRWEQHRAPLDAFSRLACQSELALAVSAFQDTGARPVLESLHPVPHRSQESISPRVRIIHMRTARRVLPRIIHTAALKPRSVQGAPRTEPPSQLLVDYSDSDGRRCRALSDRHARAEPALRPARLSSAC